MNTTSTNAFRTEQESFWAGDFGSEYIRRNIGPELLAANLAFFARALRATNGIQSCIEFGSNVGMNLRALKLLLPSADLHAIEINADAARELGKVIEPRNVIHGSILEFEPSRRWDLVLIKGVLIHIDPSSLQAAYERLVAASARYLLLCEYYNPVPVEVPYRGHANRLFKRDFAGELMDAHPEMRLVDYGFLYRRDPHFPQDDANWFLMERRG